MQAIQCKCESKCILVSISYATKMYIVRFVEFNKHPWNLEHINPIVAYIYVCMNATYQLGVSEIKAVILFPIQVHGPPQIYRRLRNTGPENNQTSHAGSSE